MTHGSQGHERATKQRHASRKSKIHNHTCLGILIATLQSPQDTRENGYQYLIPTCEGLERLVTCVGLTRQTVCFTQHKLFASLDTQHKLFASVPAPIKSNWNYGQAEGSGAHGQVAEGLSQRLVVSWPHRTWLVKRFRPAPRITASSTFEATGWISKVIGALITIALLFIHHVAAVRRKRQQTKRAKRATVSV